MRKQQETVESFSIESEREGEKIKTQVTLLFESGRYYQKIYYDYDEKLENIQIGDHVMASMHNERVVGIE